MSAVVAATYDAYFIASELSVRERGVSRPELHSIAYLACLLAVYASRTPEYWRYEFTSTKAGAPYAEALDEALTLLEAAGAITEASGLFKITERGTGVFAELRGLPSLAERENFLEPGCGVTLALPLPTVTEAVIHEPQLRAAVMLGQSRRLLDEAGLIVVDEHFRNLRSVLTTDSAQSSDLLIAAIVWLSYLGRDLPAEVANAV